MKKITLFFLTCSFCFFFISKVEAKIYQCGEKNLYSEYNSTEDTCDCVGGSFIRMPSVMSGAPDRICCGWTNAFKTYCYEKEEAETPTPTDDEAIEIPEVGAETLNQFNPLKQFSDKADRLSTPGGIISEVLGFAFPIAGIVLFVIMVLAGFKILSGATNSKAIDEGKQMITSALIGFIILFAAYWIAQLIQLIFGISILGN